MQTAKNMKEYRKQLSEAMEEDFQRKALDNFVVAYRQGRAKAFSEIDLPALVQAIGGCKDEAVSRLEELFAEFKDQAEAKGVQVHLARTDKEANRIIAGIAAENSCGRIVKSKSMTAEETQLNHYLEKEGLEVVETDLGEWIIQLRQEGPTHMVMPAIHLSRDQVSQLFSSVTGQTQGTDIESLVKVARRELRQRFATADMGISGANFAIAESGTLGLVTNEGNARLVTTLPRVHVALVGLDKLIPSLEDALRTLKGLTRNATGQAISSYVTWITGANECQSAPESRKVMHIVFLDNGRSGLAKDPIFSEALRCVRCGACANVCPIYRLIGGHKYGHIYIGAIGLVLTFFFHGLDKDKQLVQNCLNCQACRQVCIAGIDLPRLIKEVQSLIQDEGGRPLWSRFMARVLTNRRLFHSLLRTAKVLQKPVTGGQPFLRHLPHFLLREHGFKALPALASKPFRDRFPKLKPSVPQPRLKVALFTGCLQDFVYPEQLEAAVKLLSEQGVELELPLSQGCCGLPVHMLGEKKAAREVALHNLSALEPAEYDHILTLCASCGSHMKENYPLLLQGASGLQVKIQQFADKVIDLSSLLYRVLDLWPAPSKAPREPTAYHAPCHLCRGLGVDSGPRELLQRAELDYMPHPEEETCCGLGGTYSVKFPEVSSEIVHNRMQMLEDKGVKRLVTDCPGCIMQLRGCSEKRGGRIRVMHMAEALSL